LGGLQSAREFGHVYTLVKPAVAFIAGLSHLADD
jgi:hypothetical protein